MTDELCQFRASWTLASIPRETWDLAAAGTRADIHRDLERHVVAQAAVYTPPPRLDREVDEASVAAFSAGLDEGLPFLVEHVEVAPHVALLAEHLARIVDDIELARTGDAWTARGWIPARVAELLDGYYRVSPGFRNDLARLRDLGGGLRYVGLSIRLGELSVVRSPMLDGTSFAVGRPGVAWVPPLTGDAVYGAPYPHGDTLRFVTDRAEARYAKRDAERAAADRARLAALSGPTGR